MTTREQMRSLFRTQLEADAWQQQHVNRLQEIERGLRLKAIKETREEWTSAIAKADQRWTAEQGCQTKAEYMAEVVAHDRANDPPDLYWRFRFAEVEPIASVAKVASGGSGGSGGVVVKLWTDALLTGSRHGI